MTAQAHTVGSERFFYIDGLRGIAAVMVAVGHLLAATEAKHPGILGSLPSLGDFGRYGVQIFFVLSGFVIAHSVNDGVHSWNFLGRFAARRSVRLDLPYWLVIGLELSLLSISGYVMAQYARSTPSLPEIAANAFYLQMFLGYEHILPIFWTLCYEIQFYLAFVTALVLLRQAESWPGMQLGFVRNLRATTLALSFAVSLFIYVGVIPSLHEALFDDRWFQFALGVITYSYFRGQCSWRPLVAANLACILAAVFLSETNYRFLSLLVTAGTSIVIIASMKSQPWRSLLSGRTLQFLGRISYSLYLLHLPIGWRVVVLLRELSGAHYNSITAALIFIAGMAASVGSAWLLCIFVERPALTLAKRIELPRKPAERYVRMSAASEPG